jgi:hypothetical protein
MNLKKGIIILVIMLLVVESNVGQLPAPPPPPPGLPINGLTELFLLIGICYGTKKMLKDNR